jgi:invasion protein IalB
MFESDMIRRQISSLTLGAALALCVASGSAMAQEPKLLGEFNDWAVYTYKGKNGSVCYAVSQPKDSTPKNVNRDPVHFLITNRPGDNVRGEVNTIIGYPFKKGSTATLQIDGSSFTLFTSGDGAWADSSNKDQQVVAAMKRGAKMTVTGRSQRGTQTVDQYSLSGVTAAVDKINGTCK